jgi:hypothetical protein
VHWGERRVDVIELSVFQAPFRARTPSLSPPPVIPR